MECRGRSEPPRHPPSLFVMILPQVHLRNGFSCFPPGSPRGPDYILSIAAEAATPIAT